MVELKLAKLPDRVPVKIALVVSAELNKDLQDYAELYRLSYGTAESVAELIPFMLSAFIANDPGFKKAKSGK